MQSLDAGLLEEVQFAPTVPSLDKTGKADAIWSATQKEPGTLSPGVSGIHRLAGSLPF